MTSFFWRLQLIPYVDFNSDFSCKLAYNLYRWKSFTTGVKISQEHLCGSNWCHPHWHLTFIDGLQKRAKSPDTWTDYCIHVTNVQRGQGQKLDSSQSETWNHDSRSAASEAALRKKTGSKKGTAEGIKVKSGVFGLTQEITQLFCSQMKRATFCHESSPWHRFMSFPQITAPLWQRVQTLVEI